MKARRQRMILELISRRAISTQEDLTAALAEEGIHATQGTVSRDVRELGLLKAKAGDGRLRYVPQRQVEAPADRLLRIFRECVLKVESSGNIVVVSTMTATADAVCEAIDGMALSEVIGTIAGERTVFLVVRPPEAGEVVTERLRGWMGG